MKKQKMDLWMTSSLDGYGSPIPIGGWKGIHQGRRKKKNKFLFWISAACLILFASLALWNYGTDPARDQLSQTEKQVSQQQPESSEENINSSEIRPAENGTIVEEVPLDGSGVHPEPTKYLEVSGAPETSFAPISTVESESIDSKPVAPVRYSIKEINTLQLIEKSYSRFSNRFSCFFEAGLSVGKPDFADNANLALYRSSYSTYVKSQDLRQIERDFGFVVYYQGLRRWSLGTGLSISHTEARGKVHYAYYESGLNLVDFGTQNWPDNTLRQTSSLSHETTIRSWNIHVPLRFRLQPFAYYGPFMEIGACYSYNLSNQGEWLNPETLTVERSKNLVPKHLFSAELAVGYQWKLSRTSVSLHYRFSPWSTKYAPIQGKMGTNLHGIHIQMQLPH